METQHYRDLLRADNERGAAEALRNNETFIASLPRGLDTDTGNDQKRDNPPDDRVRHFRQNASPPQGDQTAREKRREALQKLLARINTQHQDARPPGVVAAAMWSTTGTPGTAPHASPSGTVTSQHPRSCRRRVWTPATRQAIPADTGTDPRTGLHRHRSGL